MFWDFGDDVVFTSNPGSVMYTRRSTDSTLLQQAQDDVRAAYPDQYPYNTFVPESVTVITASNFTYPGGDESDPVSMEKRKQKACQHCSITLIKKAN